MEKLGNQKKKKLSQLRYMITFPPTFIPSVIEYRAGGGLGAACAENKPFGLSTNSRFRSLPGGAPTLNTYGYLKQDGACVSNTSIK